MLFWPDDDFFNQIGLLLSPLSSLEGLNQVVQCVPAHEAEPGCCYSCLSMFVLFIHPQISIVSIHLLWSLHFSHFFSIGGYCVACISQFCYSWFSWLLPTWWISIGTVCCLFHSDYTTVSLALAHSSAVHPGPTHRLTRKTYWCPTERLRVCNMFHKLVCNKWYTTACT
jgi:hypothetical protein